MNYAFSPFPRLRYIFSFPLFTSSAAQHSISLTCMRDGCVWTPGVEVTVPGIPEYVLLNINMYVTVISLSIYLWYTACSGWVVRGSENPSFLASPAVAALEYNGTLNCMKHTWVLPSLWIYTGLSLQMNTAIELTYNINVLGVSFQSARPRIDALPHREPNLNLFPASIQNGHINLIIRCVIRLADERLSLWME